MNGTRHLNLVTVTTLVLMASLVLPWTAFAAVWTDKLDYSPGETVTILGDNSNGAGYLPGETVHVDVVGPNGYTAACDGVAASDSNAAWSCQVVLWDTDLAYGTYYYTATGLLSGVVEEGSFTDAPKIASYLSNCQTESNGFILGDAVCAKAYGLGNGARGTIKWWAPGLNVNADPATRTTLFGPVNGNTADQFTPVACGTWTIRVYSPASTTQPASDTFQVTQPPSAVFSWSPDPQDEGSAVQFTDESVDCDGPIVAWSWDFGGLGTSSEQHPAFTFLDNGIYNVCLTVTDSTGDTNQVCHDITVVNVAPTVSIASPVDYFVSSITSGMSLSYGWVDPGVLDTFVCTVDWGDGTVETMAGCTSPQTAFHDYTAVGAGLWPITVQVVDDDGGQGQAAITVVVYDPEAGFVTGGGWINSPQGAYTPNPDLTGRATFGFVSKYHKGASVPVGETEFQFHVAGFNFHSDSYQWLVVNQSGTNAQYKGVGAINGVGGYSFMIWGGDGAVDTFRIKIWEGEDTVIYDNGFDQPIGSGNIVVHTGKK